MNAIMSEKKEISRQQDMMLYAISVSLDEDACRCAP
jgi:hypothetical protein